MNGRIESILVASDFSIDAASAADRAALLASEHGASLQLLHVMRSDVLEEMRERLRVPGATTQQLLDNAKHGLDALATRLRPVLPAAPEAILRTGNVLEEILAAADHSDVLVLGASGQRPLKDLLIGTTAERLLRTSRRPMLIVRTAAQRLYQRVMVAVDFSLHSLAATRFALQIAPRAQIQLFHSYECPYEGRLRQASVPDATIQKYREHYREQARANMENMLAKIAAPSARTSSAIAQGDARHMTWTAAADWDADLIVLGKHGRSVMGEIFLGGVTRHTVSRARCDVAVVPGWPRL